MNPEEILRNINWGDLRTQKQTLVQVLMHRNTEEALRLEGILCMIDKLQDCAVSFLHLSETEVFGDLADVN